MPHWCLITGEYPPHPGGVGDYTRMLAHGLAEAGDEVRVLAPECAEPTPADPGVSVYRLTGHWGPQALRAATRMIDRAQGARILVQYVPHAFGLSAMNLPFCLWLYRLRRREPWVMFHEVAYPLGRGQEFRHNMLGVVTRVMAAIVARSAERIFVSTQAWEPIVRRLAPRAGAIAYLPVPSTIPVLDDPRGVAEVRGRYAPAGGLLLGHFGACGGPVCESLAAALPSVMGALDNVAALFIGGGGQACLARLVREHPGLRPRLHATGVLSPEDVSRHIAACDLMVQPYPDGISGRRTSAMAVLAHRRPLATTLGELTEPLWAESGAVVLAAAGEPSTLAMLVAKLAGDEGTRARYGARGRELYLGRFDLRHTVSALRNPGGAGPLAESCGYKNASR